MKNKKHDEIMMFMTDRLVEVIKKNRKISIENAKLRTMNEQLLKELKLNAEQLDGIYTETIEVDEIG